MPRKISDSVIVITGASCGIGRAAALAFAQRGGTVVVAARRAGPLETLAHECEEVGGRGLAVATDVTDEAAVRELARRAIETFGRIDTWVNNAAVTMFGRFEESPLKPYRRVIETNLFGYVHGARAAIPYFREQGQGVLMNVSSVVGKVGQPYASAYVASKFAIVGLSECIRQELRDADDIHVCTVLPASIDTPIFQQAANYTGRAIKPVSPVYAPEVVADVIVRCAERPRREVYAGAAGRIAALAHTIAPAWTERQAAAVVERDHFQQRDAEPSEGNLFEPLPGWTSASGGWRERSRQERAWPQVAGMVAVLCGVGLGAWWMASRNGRLADNVRRMADDTRRAVRELTAAVG